MATTHPHASDWNDSPRRRVQEAILVGLLALTLNLAGNARISLWDRDEPRYAGCTREMRASGDWLRPTFNAEPRYHKPVLIYWLMMAGTALGGDNPFGARLVSALAGTGTCLVVLAWGRRMLGDRVGLWAALILASAPIVVVESKLATTDATLAFLVVGCQFALWELARGPSKAAAAVFWVFLALATLTKGPVGPALIVASAGVSWWWGGPTDCWKRSRLRWGWGLAGFALLTAPWYVAIGLASHGDFYRVMVGRHVIHRMTTGMEDHGGFPGYYLVASLATFYPWSALLPAALVGAWARRKSSPAFGFLLGWAVGPLILLECARTKLIHYYLPAYPACALLAAWLVVSLAEARVPLRHRTLGRLSLGLLAGIGGGQVVGLLAAAWVLPNEMRWPCVALAVVLAAGTSVAVERCLRGEIERATAVLVTTWALMLTAAGAWLLPAAEPYRLSGIVGRHLAALSKSEKARPVLATFKPPGVVYTLGRPAPLIRDLPGLIEQIDGEGAAVAALFPAEIRRLEADPRLRTDVRETVRGFDVEKARSETLQMVVIRRKGSALAGRPASTRVE